jgi:hypothetical protein
MRVHIIGAGRPVLVSFDVVEFVHYYVLAYFPYFEKIKYAYEITLLSVCLCISLINFRMPESIFMKLGTYITALEPTSAA